MVYDFGKKYCEISTKDPAPVEADISGKKFTGELIICA